MLQLNKYKTTMLGQKKFSNNISFLTTKQNFKLRKKLVRCYTVSRALNPMVRDQDTKKNGAEVCGERFEM